MAQCTVLNCFDGVFGLYGGIRSSLGFAPYAPQWRLYLPVFTSNTMTRRLPYPSPTYISPAATSSQIFVGCQRLSTSLLPLCTPCLPIWNRNFPLPSNLRICVSLFPLPASQTLPS